MKYIQFTYVDKLTGISIHKAPAMNGPVFPDVAGLEFAWARESRYPTDRPEFFGTCDDSADLSVDGVLGEFSQDDWELMRADEMLARDPVPVEIEGWQGEVVMRAMTVDPDDSGSQTVWDRVQDLIAAMPDGLEKITAQTVLRRGRIRHDSPTLAQLAPLVPLSQERIDDMFRLGASIQA